MCFVCESAGGGGAGGAGAGGAAIGAADADNGVDVDAMAGNAADTAALLSSIQANVDDAKRVQMAQALDAGADYADTGCGTRVPEVPRGRMSLGVLEHYRDPVSRPFIVRGLVTDQWAWTWDSLRATFGARTMRVRTNYLKTSTRHFQKMRLDAYLDSIMAPPEDGKLPKYLGNNKVPDALLRDLRVQKPAFYGSDWRFERPSLWLGGAQTVTPLHADHDNHGNFACQFLGNKSWVFFPPAAEQYLYTTRSGVYWSKVVDPRAVDPESWPLFHKAEPLALEANLRAGDMVYVPNHWFHFVVNRSPSLMINFWVKKFQADRRWKRWYIGAGEARNAWKSCVSERIAALRLPGGVKPGKKRVKGFRNECKQALFTQRMEKKYGPNWRTKVKG